MQKTANLDYEKIINSSEFKNLVKQKRRFATPYMIIFFIALFTLPILTGYTNILENRAFGWLTWTWVYSLSMFAMVWVFTSIYMKKSKDFDKDIEEILKKNIAK
ncbi:DUF485 domain-containing protein [Filibacter tadaridae]|uniref:Inner membrane protein YjcH n=1 Tax=Filibacter tadaridae TaxID=2483811 RepID=A0A3P5XI28_9BACL|nr:DUF485 domain-containing protein [Filibacter tadaridae]VDC28150.1 hypothetical protein FILTAD_01770 [Filibacter tadaridae]